MTEGDLPEDVADEAERLTRLARRAVDENEAEAYLTERDELLEAHGFTARRREEAGEETLVLHPAAWLGEDDTVRVERVEDVDRGVEIPLDGTADPDDWDAVAAHNQDVATTVAETYGEPHGATAAAFADFMGNHYAKRIEDATPAEVTEFREEYFPRNAFPTDTQKDALAQSLEYVYEIVDVDPPTA
jgi:hypothetical protein